MGMASLRSSSLDTGEDFLSGHPPAWKAENNVHN